MIAASDRRPGSAVWRTRSDFIYTKNSARPGSDFTYTKNSARLRLRATLYEDNLGGDATEIGNFQRRKMALQGTNFFYYINFFFFPKADKLGI